MKKLNRFHCAKCHSEDLFVNLNLELGCLKHCLCNIAYTGRLRFIIFYLYFLGTRLASFNLSMTFWAQSLVIAIRSYSLGL